MYEVVNQTFPAPELEITSVQRIDIYRQAIKRTFADLYGVAADTVEVSWASDDRILVDCAGKRFNHFILSNFDDSVLEFVCPDEDPVIVNLTEEERNQLDRAI